MLPVGVPVIAPVLELIDSPVGKPVADQLYGGAPPEPATVELYAAVFSACGNVVVEIVGAALITRVYAFVTWLSPS